ncbi:protein disulfide isomerase family A, member 3, partial [Paragonimus westermani]
TAHYMCHAQTRGMILFLFFLPFAVCSELPEFTTDDFNVRVNEKPNTLVMFYAPWYHVTFGVNIIFRCGHCKKLKPSFIAAGERLAATTDNIALALVDCTTQEGICGEFGVKGYPTIKLFKDGKHVHDFDGTRDEEGIVNYMLKRSKPVVRELSDANQLADMLESPGAGKQPVIVAYIESSRKGWLESFRELASELLMDASFAQAQVPDVLDVVDGKSLVRLYRPKNMLSRLDSPSVDFDGEWTKEGLKDWIFKNSPESFTEFLKKFMTGSLIPHVKSEEIPTEQKGAVVKVVAHTFDSVVNDPSKDVFVIFHAPWCGHCKHLMPKFETAAEKLKDEPDILFAAVDATANDIPELFLVHGYPTLYFVPKLSKEAPKQYEGGREVDDLINFVARESSQELRGYDRTGVAKKSEL